MSHPNTERHFWSNVKVGAPTQCWPWRGKLNSSGYGSFSFEGRVDGAHVWAFKFDRRKLKAKHCVLHRCDNRICCNPTHLFSGTKSDNSKDAWRKGRNILQTNPEILPRGERHHNAKINEEKARQIRALWERGELNQSEIGSLFEITQANVSQIVRKKSWKGGA